MISQEKLYLFILHFINGLYVNLSHLKPGIPNLCQIPVSYTHLDELYKQSGIDIILPRHEQALVHEADAYARTTGKVGVCLVTSGPGATNLVTGLATANYDSVPLVCFTGQVARHLIGNDAFQEVDIVGITRSITKYGVTVRNRADLGRIIKEAFYICLLYTSHLIMIQRRRQEHAEKQQQICKNDSHKQHQITADILKDHPEAKPGKNSYLRA